MDKTEPPDAETEGHALSAASNLSDVSEEERTLVEANSRPNAPLIHETIRAEGESELSRPAIGLLLSGLAAGLTIGLSLVTEGLIRAHLPEAPWRDLISKLGYAVGFLVVVLGRQQLFTENTLTPILPLLYHRDARTLRQVARLWGIVLIANLAGTWGVAAVLAGTGLFPPEATAAFSAISRHAIEASFGMTALKAICAGWLIALMVWLIPGSGESRPVVIALLTWLIALAGFAHVIAGSVDASFLVLSSQASVWDYAWRFFVPTLIGNVLGGVFLVAVLNYGQVADEVHARRG